MQEFRQGTNEKLLAGLQGSTTNLMAEVWGFLGRDANGSQQDNAL